MYIIKTLSLAKRCFSHSTRVHCAAWRTLKNSKRAVCLLKQTCFITVQTVIIALMPFGRNVGSTTFVQPSPTIHRP